MQNQTMQTKAGQDTGKPYTAKKSRTKQHNAKQCNPKQSLAKQSNANPSTVMQSKAIKSEEGAKKTNWCGGIWKKTRVPNDIVWTFILSSPLFPPPSSLLPPPSPATSPAYIFDLGRRPTSSLLPPPCVLLPPQPPHATHVKKSRTIHRNRSTTYRSRIERHGSCDATCGFR